MNLNEEEKQKLRQQYEQKAASKNLISRLHIKKEILEQLVFSPCKENLFFTSHIEHKAIVWGGDFFQKIDLQELCFDDVWWGNRFYKNFKNTNVLLDFSKKEFLFYDNTIRYCDFSGLDLSHSSFETFKTYEHINLQSTKLPENFGHNQCFDFCNFKNSNLSIELSSHELCTNFLSCNLSNTNTTIIHKERKLNDYEKKVLEEYREYEEIAISLPHENEDARFYQEKLTKIRSQYKDLIEYTSSSEYLDIALKNGYLNGCIIKNDRKNPFPEETKIKKI